MKSIILALMLFCAVSGFAQSWDYQITFLEGYQFAEGINEIGSNGWELVFARRAMRDDDKYGYEMIFKRRHQIASSGVEPGLSARTIVILAVVVGAIVLLIFLIGFASTLTHIRKLLIAINENAKRKIASA